MIHTRVPEEPIRWIQAWPNASNPEFRVGRVGKDLIAEWVGLATLRSDRTGTHSEFRLARDKFHRGQVRALLRHLHGGLTMHASAAAIDDVAIGFLGPSGSGKSSTVAMLCQRHGAAFVSDDTTAIDITREGATAVPLETHSWLPAESLRALGLPMLAGRWKAAVSPARLAQGPVALAAVIKLEFDGGIDKPELTHLGGQTAFQALTTSAIRFVLDEQDVTLHDFRQISELATRIPVYELRRPRRADNIGCSAEIILDVLRSHGQVPRALGAPKT